MQPYTAKYCFPLRCLPCQHLSLHTGVSSFNPQTSSHILAPVFLPLTQAANVFKYPDNRIGRVYDGNDNQAMAIHGFTEAFSQL